jgi:hypothetical protein
MAQIVVAVAVLLAVLLAALLLLDIHLYHDISLKLDNLYMHNFGLQYILQFA